MRSPLEVLHDDIEARARRLAVHHGPSLACRRGCSGCCSDDLSVWRVEADRIRAAAGALLAAEAPHPPGACALLDAEGACRVYDVRPYVCRTQGLPLRWTEPDEDEPDALVERRDVCPLNEPGVDLLSLGADELWTLGPTEERLFSLEAEAARAAGRALERVALRALFSVEG